MNVCFGSSESSGNAELAAEFKAGRREDIHGASAFLSKYTDRNQGLLLGWVRSLRHWERSEKLPEFIIHINE
jgi:hypothetical protein